MRSILGVRSMEGLGGIVKPLERDAKINTLIGCQRFARKTLEHRQELSSMGGSDAVGNELFAASPLGRHSPPLEQAQRRDSVKQGAGKFGNPRTFVGGCDWLERIERGFPRKITEQF